MPEIELTVQTVSFPKEGKKLGYIKSSEGEFYGADPGMLVKFAQGEVCKIEYSETPKKVGTGSWKNIKKKLAGTPPVLQKPPVQYPRARANPADSEQIFTVALLKEVYNKDMTALELVEEIKKLRQVYRNTFGATEANRDDEMRDEIPY